MFKVVSDSHGDLTYIRIYSGHAEKGTRVLNPNNNKKENVSRIFEMHAKDRQPLEEAELRTDRGRHRPQEFGDR